MSAVEVLGFLVIIKKRINAGKWFFVVTVSFALYNIISSEDKTRATAKEAVVIGSSLGGMVAGGYIASLSCFNCVQIFIGQQI